MKKTAYALAFAAALMGTACASFNVTAEKLTHQAIVDSEALHCGAKGAPPVGQCLTDAQFQATNLELNKIAVGGREFTKLTIAKQATSSDALAFVGSVEQSIKNLRVAPYTGVIAKVLSDLATLDAQVTKFAKSL